MEVHMKKYFLKFLSALFLIVSFQVSAKPIITDQYACTTASLGELKIFVMYLAKDLKKVKFWKHERKDEVLTLSGDVAIVECHDPGECDWFQTSPSDSFIIQNCESNNCNGGFFFQTLKPFERTLITQCHLDQMNVPYPGVTGGN